MNDAQQTSDEELWARSHEGDVVAFEDLYHRNNPRLLVFLSRKVQQDADDLAQRTWAKIYAMRPKKGYLLFRPYLYQIARNEVWDHLGRRGRVHSESEGFDPPDPRSINRKNRFLECLQECLERLGDNAFVKVLIAGINGRSVAEIADECGIAPQTVYTQRDRGRDLLKSCITSKLDADAERGS
jgi:RNA polymerase sigma factor (sigma-70 family)